MVPAPIITTNPPGPSPYTVRPVVVTLTPTMPGAEIRYTLDDLDVHASVPVTSSGRYTAPLDVSAARA